MIPADQNQIIETLDDIEELNTCYNNLGIDKVQLSNKKAKANQDSKEA